MFIKIDDRPLYNKLKNDVRTLVNEFDLTDDIARLKEINDILQNLYKMNDSRYAHQEKELVRHMQLYIKSRDSIHIANIRKPLYKLLLKSNPFEV